MLADAGAEHVDRDHRDDHDDDLRRGVGILKAADALVERLADPAGADDAERGRRAHIGLEPVERERAPQRHDLRDDAEDDLLQPARAGRPNSFDRPRIDGLDRLGEQFRDHAEIVNEKGHDAGERAEADRHDEHQREYDLVDGAAGVHQAADRLHDPLRADIRRAQDREGDPEHDGERRAPDRDLHGHDHVGEVVVPVVEIRLQKCAAEFRHVAPVGEQGRHAEHFRRRPGPGQQREHGEPDQPIAQAARQRIGRNRDRGQVLHDCRLLPDRGALTDWPSAAPPPCCESVGAGDACGEFARSSS